MINRKPVIHKAIIRGLTHEWQSASSIAFRSKISTTNQIWRLMKELEEKGYVEIKKVSYSHYNRGFHVFRLKEGVTTEQILKELGFKWWC